MHKKCIVIDLDETLVHSSFKVITESGKVSYKALTGLAPGYLSDLLSLYVVTRCLRLSP